MRNTWLGLTRSSFNLDVLCNLGVKACGEISSEALSKKKNGETQEKLKCYRVLRLS